MGNHKRKRKSRSLNQDDGLSNPKSFKLSDVPLFLDDLHEEPFRILSDLLLEKNLVFVEVGVYFCISFDIWHFFFQGPVGCGKTSLVRRVAQTFDLPVKTFQLSDQIDSKVGCIQFYSLNSRRTNFRHLLEHTNAPKFLENLFGSLLFSLRSVIPAIFFL